MDIEVLDLEVKDVFSPSLSTLSLTVRGCLAFKKFLHVNPANHGTSRIERSLA